ERPGDAHAIPQVEDDPATAAFVREAVVADGVLKRLLEVGSAGGILLFEGLEGIVELALFEEAVRSRLGLDIDRPDGGAIVLAHVLDDRLGDFAGSQERSAILTGRGVDQDEEVPWPRVFTGLESQLDLPADDRVLV